MAEVRTFLQLLADVRKRCNRPVAFLLIHHENRAGQISGAWEGAVDTMLHVTGMGNGHTRLHIQKARWASDHHGKTVKLAWADNDSYQVEAQNDVTDDKLADRIRTVVGENPGRNWRRVEDAIPGVRSERRRTVRDRLLAEGKLVNIGRQDGADVWLTDCPKARQRGSAYLMTPQSANCVPSRTMLGRSWSCLRPAGVRQPQPQLRPASRL